MNKDFSSYSPVIVYTAEQLLQDVSLKWTGFKTDPSFVASGGLARYYKNHCHLGIKLDITVTLDKGCYRENFSAYLGSRNNPYFGWYDGRISGTQTFKDFIHASHTQEANMTDEEYQAREMLDNGIWTEDKSGYLNDGRYVKHVLTDMTFSLHPQTQLTADYRYETPLKIIGTSDRDELIFTWSFHGQNHAELVLEQKNGEEWKEKIYKLDKENPTFTPNTNDYEIRVPPGTLKPGKVNVLLRMMYYEPIGYPGFKRVISDRTINLGDTVNLGVQKYETTVIDLADTAPLLYLLLPNQESKPQNVDEDITITWDSERQERYKLEILQNGQVVQRYEGTTEKSLTIPARLIDNVITELELTVSNTTNAITKMAQKNVYFNTVDKKPKIFGLEPNGINQDVQQDIHVSWASEYQDSYTLQVYENSVLKHTYSGGTETELIIPPDTIKNSIVKLVLTLSNTINNKIKQSTAEATFIAYGKPEPPILSLESVYNTAFPAITWKAQEQVAYEVKIQKNGVNVDYSDIVISNDKFYLTQTPLDNGAEYTVFLRIKNKYDKFSDFVNKTFSVSYPPLPKTALTLIKDGENVLINGVCEDSAEFHHITLLRRAEYERKWTVIADSLKNKFAFTDTELASNTLYYYKAYTVSKNGAITESNIKTISIKLTSVIFENVENKDVVYFQNITGLDFTNVKDIDETMYLSNSYPTVSKSKTDYIKAKIEITALKDKFLRLKRLLSEARVGLYRDGEGNKFYFSLIDNIEYKRVNPIYYTISFTIAEINYNEQKGVIPQKLIYEDGVYKWVQAT